MKRDGSESPPEEPSRRGDSEAGLPALWNPRAVRVWGFVFSWGFGAVLLARNWRALGDPAKANRSMLWCYSMAPWIAVALLVPDTPTLNRLFWLACGLVYLSWAVVEATPQVRLVDERLGHRYHHRSWLLPLALGVAFLIVSTTLALFVDVIRESGGP